MRDAGVAQWSTCARNPREMHGTSLEQLLARLGMKSMSVQETRALAAEAR